MTSGNNWQRSDWKALEGQWFNDKYQLIHFKGDGGFGAVFTVNEIIADSLIRNETEIVMKVIPIDADNLQQQIRELQLAVRLKHPCLINCDTVEQGNLNNRPFLGLVMELAQYSLADYVLEKPSQTLPPEEITTIIQSVATGLDYLHNQLDREQQRIVHRDLKPGNVLRVKNAWKISDFGIARLLEAGKTTVVSQVIGTPIYIPPEGYDGTISPAWDLWSLGVMIIELFTGKYPFNATSPMQFMRKVLLEEPEIPDNIPSSLKEIVKGCLVKEYQQRWTAQQVLEALQENPRSNLPHKVASKTVTPVNWPTTYSPQPSSDVNRLNSTLNDKQKNDEVKRKKELISKKVGWKFSLIWSFISFVSFLFFIVVFYHFDSSVSRFHYSSDSVAYNPVLMMLLLVPILSEGIGQFWLLKRHLENCIGWILVTILPTLTCWFIGLLVFVDSYSPEAGPVFVLCFTGKLLSAVPQSIYLKRKLRNSTWWTLIVSIILFIISYWFLLGITTSLIISWLLNRHYKISSV